MGYKTGRSRTLTASGTFTGAYVRNLEVTGDFTFEVVFSNGHVRADIDPSDGNFRLFVELNGTTDTETIGMPGYGDSTHPPNVNFDASGHFTVSIPVEEWVNCSAIVETPGDANNQTIVSPQRYAVNFYELTTAGDATVTVTAAGITASVTVASPGMTVAYTQEAELSGSLLDTTYAHTGGSVAASATSSCGFSLMVNGASLGGTMSHTQYGASVSSAGSISLSVPGSTTNVQHGLKGIAAGCTLSQAPDKLFSLSGIIDSMGDSYPGSVLLDCSRYSGDPAPTQSVGSSFTVSGTQKQSYEAIGISEVNDDSSQTTLYSQGPVSLDQWQPFAPVIDSGWCTSNGEYVTYPVTDDAGDVSIRVVADTVFHLHGWTFGGAGLAQAAELILDPCTSAAGWSGATASAGGLSSTAASMTRTFTPAKNLSGYRYLRVTMKVDSGSHPFTVTAGGKNWSIDHTGAALTATTTAQTFDIDLCDPSGDSSGSDATDTRWPVSDPILDYSDSVATPAVDGPLWGVGYAGGISIGGLTSGSVYTLSHLSQVRRTEVVCHALPTHAPRFDLDMLQFAPEGTNDSGTTTTARTRRFLMCETDGRQSLEYGDVEISKVEGASGTTFYTQLVKPISDLAAYMPGGDTSADSGYTNGQYPGWTATTLAPAPGSSSNLRDGFLNSGSPAVWLMGAGLFWDSGSGAWQSGVGMSATVGVSLPAQVIFSTIDWYPGIGDAFGHFDGAYGDTLKLVGHKIFRAEAHGITLGIPHGPKPGESVSLYAGTGEVQPVMPAVGSCTSDSPEGAYRTTGAGLIGYTTTGTGTAETTAGTIGNITGSGLGPGSGSTSFFTRHLSRLALRIATMWASAGGLANLGRRGGSYHRAAAIAGSSGPGGIVHWRADVGDSYSWIETALPVTTRASASQPSLAEDYRGKLILGYVDDGSGTYAAGGYETFSYADGGGAGYWSDPVIAISGAKYYRVRGGKDGSIMRLGWVDDGSGHSTGHLYTRYQAPGDTSPSAQIMLTDETGAAIVCADNGPDLDHVAASTSPWRISVMEAGNTTPSEFICYSELAAAWKRVS